MFLITDVDANKKKWKLLTNYFLIHKKKTSRSITRSCIRSRFALRSLEKHFSDWKFLFGRKSKYCPWIMEFIKS